MRLMILTTATLLSLASLSPAAEPAGAAPVKIEQAEKQLASGAQLLDVRTKEEWDEGHLKNASLVTVTEGGFLEKAKAKFDPKKPDLVGGFIRFQEVRSFVGCQLAFPVAAIGLLLF